MGENRLLTLTLEHFSQVESTFSSRICLKGNLRIVVFGKMQLLDLFSFNQFNISAFFFFGILCASWANQFASCCHVLLSYMSNCGHLYNILGKCIRK